MKKILITGSNGLLGQKIVYALRERKDVILIATSKGENRIREKKGYSYLRMDITDASEVEDVLRSYLPDSVINTAAMTNVDACETEKEDCRKLNISGVKNIIQGLEKTVAVKKEAGENYAPHLVHLSTDFVFDGEKGPYSEEDIPNPLSYYAWSKLESEKAVMASKLDWAVIRTIIIYGVSDNQSRSNVVLWAKEALEKGKPINVVDDQFRSPTLAEDLAEACISAALKNAKGIFHVSGDEIMSIFELVKRVADYFHLDRSMIKSVSSDSLKQAAKRPPRTGFILDKAKRLLDYKPHTFEEGLKILEGQLRKI